MDNGQIGKIIEDHQGELGSLISILEDIQEKYHYLPAEALKTVARETGLSLVDIYGVATFYKAFSLKPRGRHLVSVCMGTACHVRNAPAVVDEFSRQLDLKPGETSGDKEFTLETVNCLGTCALGPIVMVDGHYFSNVKRQDVGKIIEKSRSGFEETAEHLAKGVFPVEVYCPYCNESLIKGGGSAEESPSLVLDAAYNGTQGQVKISGLFGGGSVQAEHLVQPDTLLRLSCPNCRKVFGEKTRCIECGAPMVSLSFRGGGSLLVCSRLGCENRKINLNGIGVSERTSETPLEHHAG
ncbi:MAG TPA: NAD(P)H-dependent oxidoreductase subunit E [Deltaproteobacteria bacterium]|nr:NAD(P)H-dependent oxidoreductase subunit E [Deltaproteobacteria bacterium]